MPRPAKQPGAPRKVGRTRAEGFSYRYYREHGGTLTYLAWRKAMYAINEEIARQLVLQAQEVSMPGRLGKLMVCKKPTSMKRPSTDFAATKKLGKRVVHFNDHSDGYQSFVQWRKTTCNFRHFTLYGFSPVRPVSRGMSVVMFTPGGHERYPLKADVPSHYATKPCSTPS